MVEILSAVAAAELRERPVVAAPAAARSFTRRRVLSAEFEVAAERLMTWRVHEGAGLRVAASSTRVGVDEVVVLTLGRDPLRVTAPCRVIEVIDEPGRIGFAYGTLTGHPEAGEERFVIERRGSDVVFAISATSRPTGRLARLGGPLTSLVQHAITSRYLRAADRSR